ncbi:MAG: inositol monophosphatase [Candidatus Micrarchaeia archaeon]
MSEMRSFIQSCLLDATKAIGKARSAGLTIKVKGRNDRATSADMASEKLIVDRIRKEYPDALVLSEESYEEKHLEADSLFVIDPIDGTHNFMQDIPFWGVSIAHFSGGKPTAGGIYFASQKEFLYAEKGKPATLNGKLISVSKTAKLEDFFLLCDSRLHMIEDMGFMPQVLRIERLSQHTRFMGSAIYEMGYVACGKVDAEIDFKLKPYDFAAAAFIAEQAGATATDFEGKRWSLSTTKFVISNGRQHKRLLDMLNGKE